MAGIGDEMYLGRHQLGTELRIPLLCVDANDQPAAPESAPTVEIWFEGIKVLSDLMIPIDRDILVGQFGCPLYLRALDIGNYQAIKRWSVAGVFPGSYFGVEIDDFEIIDGGHDDGSVIAMFYFDTPTARYLVHQVDSGRIKPGRNPK
jgi:hypothetical protein